MINKAGINVNVVSTDGSKANIRLVGGLLLIYPGIVTDTIGLSLVAIVVVLQLLGRKSAALKQA